MGIIFAQPARVSSRDVTEAPAKLLVVVPKLVIGGTERHLLAVLPRLDRQRFAVEVATTRGPGRLDAALRDAGIPVTNARLSLPGRAAVPAAFSGLLARFAARPPDLVHFFLPEAYLVGGLAARLAPRCRTIMSRRSLNRYQAKHPLAARAERWLHRRMDAVVANSEAVMGELRAEGVPAERLHVIRNGIEVERFAAGSRSDARDRLGLAADALVMVMLATLLPYKGHELVLRALASIADSLPDGWRLLLAGRDEGLGPSLRAQAEALGLADNVVFLGEVAVEAVPEVLAAGDIGVLGSLEEGFPNAAVEGMAAGLAMVVTDVGGASEAVDGGTSGLVVPANDPQAMGQALLALAGDPAKRARLAEAGRLRARTHFSIERCVADYEALYDSLLQGASRATEGALRR